MHLVRKTIATSAVLLGIAILYGSLHKSVHGQNSPTPAAILAGIGTPSSNSVPCNLGVASASTASLYIQREASGNSIWKCTLAADGVTYAWTAPFSAPILDTTVSIGGAVLAVGGTTSGTATVTGAAVGSPCIATPSDGTIVLNVTVICTVTANTATVTLQGLILSTPPAKTWVVRVIP